MSDEIQPNTNLGKLAVDIYDQEMGFHTTGQKRITEVNLVSGWLEGHLGELNNLIFTCFSGDNPNGLNLEEQAILRDMYVSEYNRKSHRRVLRGIDGSEGSQDFQVIREGDSMIQRSNKNVIAKSYHEAYLSSRERLDELIYAYNLYSSNPRQVAGKDAPINPEDDS